MLPLVESAFKHLHVCTFKTLRQNDIICKYRLRLLCLVRNSSFYKIYRSGHGLFGRNPSNIHENSYENEHCVPSHERTCRDAVCPQRYTCVFNFETEFQELDTCNQYGIRFSRKNIVSTLQNSCKLSPFLTALRSRQCKNTLGFIVGRCRYIVFNIFNSLGQSRLQQSLVRNTCNRFNCRTNHLILYRNYIITEKC